MIDGYFENIKTSWEQTRVIAYYSAIGGNIDVKKWPKKIEQFLKFEWDKTQTTTAQDKFKHYAEMKARREQMLKNAGGKPSS